MLVKDLEFNKDTVTMLANDIKKVYTKFDIENFIKSCINSFPKQELKERMSHVTVQLHKHLTNEYIENIKILSNAMSHVETWGFIYGSVIEYVEVYGCNEENVQISLEKLAEFTRLLSSEFAIRKFFNTFEKETMEKVLEWSKSEDVNIRRLASEGTRPSLPWGPNIKVDYKIAAKPLDNLYYDSERFVTRSCANHLNDISKFDPDFVLATLKKWRSSNRQNDEEMEYIIKHSLRTLVKKGHKKTFEFLGYKLTPKVEITSFSLSPEDMKIGDTMTLDFTITPKEDTKIMVDYIISYPMKNNKISDKVYKITNFTGIKDKPKSFKRKRHMKDMSTRKMNPGLHTCSIQVNGSIIYSEKFMLNK